MVTSSCVCNSASRNLLKPLKKSFTVIYQQREQSSQATLMPTQRSIVSIMLEHVKDKLTFEFICIEIEVYILEIRKHLQMTRGVDHLRGDHEQIVSATNHPQFRAFCKQDF